MTIGLRRSRILDTVLLIVAMLVCAAILGFQASPSVRASLLVTNLILVILAWLSLRPAIKEIKLEVKYLDAKATDVLVENLEVSELLRVYVESRT